MNVEKYHDNVGKQRTEIEELVQEVFKALGDSPELFEKICEIKIGIEPVVYYRANVTFIPKK